MLLRGEPFGIDFGGGCSPALEGRLTGDSLPGLCSVLSPCQSSWRMSAGRYRL